MEKIDQLEVEWAGKVREMPAAAWVIDIRHDHTRKETAERVARSNRPRGIQGSLTTSKPARLSPVFPIVKNLMQITP